MKLLRILRKARKLGFRLGILKLIGYEAVFTCACRKRSSIEDWESPFTPMEPDARCWYADPLLCRHQDQEYVFMEAVDEKTKLGGIACAAVNDGKWGEIRSVICEDFHMSFPMIFNFKDRLYMIPETEMAEAVILYECMEFPFIWEKRAILLEGMRIVDSIVTEVEGDEIKILASMYDSENDFYTKFIRYSIYEQEDSFTARLTVEEEDFSLESRNAGYLLGGNPRVLPVQTSTQAVYGYSLKFYEWNDERRERLLKEVCPAGIHLTGRKMGKLIGVHTYSQTDRNEVIDIQYLRFNPRKWIERIRAKGEK